MMRNLWKMCLVAAMGAAIGLGAMSSMAQDKEAQIKTRRDTMKRQGDDFKAISDFVKGEGDQATALAKAEDLQAIAPKIAELFPAGTSMAEFPGKTGAKPDIWKEWDKFKAIIPTLQTEEQKLVDAIKTGDKAAIGAQLGATGKNGCGGCHTPYREKLT
ncbi:MAG TPA: cytochrome c [Stellaceae bacterium]|nr:cytochrome c [Stellaceae bacterium]